MSVFAENAILQEIDVPIERLRQQSFDGRASTKSML
jgi:hypothetical protein